MFGDQRITGMVSNQDRFVVVPSKYAFEPAGQCGMELSELLPWTKKVADEICLIRTVHSEAINHDPAITFFQTESQQPGRPSMGQGGLRARDRKQQSTFLRREFRRR